jgi:hypothetical protein
MTEKCVFVMCHGSGVFLLYHIAQFHISTPVPRRMPHHWSTPHRYSSTYTVHSHIQ